MTENDKHLTVRKYLMSESNEEEYIKNMMDEVVVIAVSNDRNINMSTNKMMVVNKRKYSNYVTAMSDDGHFNVLNAQHLKYDDIKHNDLFVRDEFKILDEGDDDDGSTLPHLPGESMTNFTLNTLNTNNTMNDGESITMSKDAFMHNVMKIDGYQWITMAFLQIDDQDWKQYVNNFKKNKVTENRLADLKNCDLKELIPKIGPRNSFERLLRNKLRNDDEKIFVE